MFDVNEEPLLQYRISLSSPTVHLVEQAVTDSSNLKSGRVIVVHDPSPLPGPRPLT